jgi:hypothetical protein
MTFKLFTPGKFESKFLWIKKKVITRWDNEPYLIRYTLMTTPWFSIKIHKILLSDDACLHDHPWSFLSIVLKNGYKEYHHRNGHAFTSFKNDGTYTLNETVYKHIKAPAILYRKANWAHRLVVDKPATTLVITFKKTRQWGFFTPSGWIKWYKYKQENQCE